MKRLKDLEILFKRLTMEENKELSRFKAEIIKLITKYKHEIFGFCCRMLGDKEKAEEVAQKVFVKYFTHKIGQIKKGVSLELGNIKSYLFKIAYHECCNIIKEEKKKDNDYKLETIPNPDCRLNPEELILFEEKATVEKYLIKKVKIIIYNLNPKDKAVFNLRHYQKMRFKEIAEIMGATENAVKLRFMRVLDKIRKNIPPEDEDLFYEVC